MGKLRVLALISLILVCLLTSACVSMGTYQELQAEFQGAEAEITNLKQNITQLNNSITDTNQQLIFTREQLNSAQRELTSTSKTLRSTEEELASTKKALKSTEEKLRLYKETLGIDIFSGIQPPYFKSKFPRLEINLVNNSSASDPTWQQLKSFVLKDETDSHSYIENIRMCGMFAEQLHNKAESAGIKAAVVGIQLRGSAEGHALNAFKTTDKGLIYIDCTGEGFQTVAYQEAYRQGKSVNADKIAYVVKDKEYGAISMGENTPFDYNSYERMKSDWDSYEEKLKAYNNEVQKFNNETSGEIYYIGTKEWERITQWEKSLEEQKRELSNLEARLEPLWKPMGTVSRIEIYW